MTTFWLITQYLLIFMLIASSAAFLVAMFHPLRFDVKLRASIRGQRAEIWFVYLFRIFKIGVIATPHTQDIVLKIFTWKKLIERQQRTRTPAPARPVPPAEKPDKPDASVPASNTTTGAKPADDNLATIKEPVEQPSDISVAEEEEEEKAAEPIIKAASATTEEAKIIAEPSQTDPTEAAAVISHDDKPETAQITSENEISPPSEIKPPEIKPPEIKPVDTTPLKPISESSGTETKKSPAPEKPQDKAENSATTADTSIRQKLRKFKRDLSRRFRQFQSYARIFRQKWRLLIPIFKKFWQRGKKGFGLLNPAIKLRYALHEQYLTGMMQANMAVLSGFAGRFGLNFIPVPVFTEPGVYGKGYVSAVIRPWRLVIAALGLLFEKQLYKELWQAFKWYRQRQKK